MITAIRDENNRYRNLLNGQWVGSKSDTYIEIKSPIDNTV